MENARKKLKEKDLDMIILNKPGKSTGFISDTNKVSVIYKNKKSEDLPLMSKKELAHKLLEIISSML